MTTVEEIEIPADSVLQLRQEREGLTPCGGPLEGQNA